MSKIINIKDYQKSDIDRFFESLNASQQFAFSQLIDTIKNETDVLMKGAVESTAKAMRDMLLDVIKKNKDKDGKIDCKFIMELLKSCKVVKDR